MIGQSTEAQEALKLIRQAGYNETNWAIWAQKMAAWGMQPDRWPKPPDDAPKPPEAIDYRELLKKYIKHVKEGTGDSFIWPNQAVTERDQIKADDWEELVRLNKELGYE